MDQRMKVLVAHDGSPYADAALDDLRRAGLPGDAEALVVSVADGLVNVSSSAKEVAGVMLTSRRVTSAIELARGQAERLLEEAQEAAAMACGRLLWDFPGWVVRTKVLEGTPSWELLRVAERWRPDLVVAGSQGRSALGRFFLGSVSEALAAGANSSVRVGRRVEGKEGRTPPRLVVGVDGSPGARRAVRAVGSRVWPAGTGVRLIVVDDGSGPTKMPHVRPNLAELVTACGEDEPVSARLMAEGARAVLNERGLSASVGVREGDPRRVLDEEARAWAADTIFVGSHGLDNPGERSGLGAVSTELIRHAACSVEVVR
ncbi:MAG TPA: universal stress protein [Pyrinomonadaceae bacterium]